MSGEELRALLAGGPAIQPLALLLGFTLLAFLSDRIARLMLRIASRTNTELDDQLIHAIRPAVVASFLLMGLGLASLTFELPELGRYVVRGALSTIAVIYWAYAAENASQVALEFLSTHQDRLRLVQPRTLPATTA